MQTLKDLTDKDIAALTAGPETDALVAEAIGLNVVRVGVGYLVHPPDGPRPGRTMSEKGISPVQPYSTDRNAAGEATDWVCKTFWRSIEVRGPNVRGGWMCVFRARGKPCWEATAPTEPLARCKAVLLAWLAKRATK